MTKNDKPKKAPVDRVTRWKFFSRVDRLRITSEKRFNGIRGQLWNILRKSDGAAVGEVLTRCVDAGITEDQALSALKRMLTVYNVIRVERAE